MNNINKKKGLKSDDDEKYFGILFFFEGDNNNYNKNLPHELKSLLNVCCRMSNKQHSSGLLAGFCARVVMIFSFRTSFSSNFYSALDAQM